MRTQRDTSTRPEQAGGEGAGSSGHRPFEKFLAILIAALLLAANAGMSLYNRATRPGAVETAIGIVRIAEGSTARTIAKELLPRRFDRRLFRVLARARGLDESLKYGSYRVDTPMSLWALIDMLAEGVPADYVKVTVPEGFTIEQIAKALELQGIVAAETFILAANDPHLFASLGVPAATLEGYLFPDTYLLVPETSAEDVIWTMTARFRQVMTELQGPTSSLYPEEVYDIVRVASIIEREASLDEEKPFVAAVIYNRLARNMRLQCDATIRYGLKQYHRHLTYAELDANTPHNTYLYDGLPPTPISNPGRVALAAALRPADSDYLYFVSRNDGTHKFSSTLAEHNIAVRKYQGITRYRRR